MDVIEMRGIYKYFGSFCANKNVNFNLRRGEIHALLGENGAGKSTLMKILYGLYSSNEGQIFINGEQVRISTPNDAIAKGVGMVHQHFMLIPQLTITQNVFMGMKEAGLVYNMKELNGRVTSMSARFGFNVNDPSAYIWQLPVGVQQKVEIIKVLMRNANILILDEPTAVLTPQEVDELFKSLKSLVKEGYSIILITHHMNEVLDFCDRVTVMRMGEVISTVNVKDTNADDLAHMMVGRNIHLNRQVEPQAAGKAMIEVRDLHVKNNKGLEAVKGVSFTVRAGEIIGIAGVDGNGQLELAEAIVGGRKIEKGEVFFNGEDVSKKSIRYRLDNGMAHIPDDRQKKGLVMQMTVKDNFIISNEYSDRYKDKCFLNFERIDKAAESLVKEYDVRPNDISFIAGSLSGGNQQKVILAREVDRNPAIMLAVQPTRGLDVGAIEFVRSKLIEERKRQTAVLLISTDLEEILSLADRILVMYGGEFMGEVSYDISEMEIGLLMAGTKQIHKEKEAAV